MLDTKSQEKSSRRKDVEAPRSDNVKDWTQEELDRFISKNDWGSVAKYINEMRQSKDNQREQYDQIPVRREPSIREIQERVELNRSLDRETSSPQSRFGARSQMQHDEISRDTPSETVESESVWQSLSSASYVSEETSEYDRRRGSSDRRRSSPREVLL